MDVQKAGPLYRIIKFKTSIAISNVKWQRLIGKLLQPGLQGNNYFQLKGKTIFFSYTNLIFNVKHSGDTNLNKPEACFLCQSYILQCHQINIEKIQLQSVLNFCSIGKCNIIILFCKYIIVNSTAQPRCLSHPE